LFVCLFVFFFYNNNNYQNKPPPLLPPPPPLPTMPPKRSAAAAADSAESDSKKVKLTDTTATTDDASSSTTTTTTKKVWMKKGAAAVDIECDVASTTHVVDQNGDVYDAMLNQTDISYSLKGHNKFIVLQVLQDDHDPAKNYLWQRWGRVGSRGQTKLLGPLTLTVAIGNFSSK